MTLPVIFHERAENELNEAAAFYAQARPGLGDAFIAEAQNAMEALVASPLAGQTVEGDIRWWLVRRFPYSVFSGCVPITFVSSRLGIKSDGPSTGVVGGN